MKTLFSSLALAILMTSPLSAQDAGEDAPGNIRFWAAELGGGHYMVKLGAIVSASRHEYVSDGVARVVEVTIATDSSVAARFYFVEPVGKNSSFNTPGIIANRVESTVNKLGGRAGVDSDTTVVKNYPASTHAHTVEFRVGSLTALDSLYNSLTSSIQSGRGKVWRGK